MSDTASSASAEYQPIRTLAVRIRDDLRTQLDLIAQLNERSVTEEIRLAIEDWIERSKSDPKVLARADAIRAEIERDAEKQRNAISAIFGSAGPAPKAKGKQAEA